MTTPPPSAIDQAFLRARDRLLSLRGEHGHWEGYLSSSALSTATAVCALDAYRAALGAQLPQDQLVSLVQRGRTWLVENQNADGGWGDTTLSFSNISTTALCWAALAADPSRGGEALAAAKQWLVNAAGSLEPSELAEAVRRRYGKDQTFSVPILTTLALTGCLGSEREAWRHVPQLPFELAACPPRWFARLQLPVVSYALPALIAIGRVRHHRRPTKNPLTWAVRMSVRDRTQRILQTIQPENGGFLEATPLTSFVVLSLIGAEMADHPVVVKGIGFLVRSVRADGSWPIDTNLATWVSTLAINALANAGTTGGAANDPSTTSNHVVGIETADALRQWLVEQQYRREHPYTHAAPGGWGWTDLAGAVPDADDTAGALLALKTWQHQDDDLLQAATAGVGWLIDLQNSDGGIPTFCRGWGALPFDRSSPDLTAHAVRAWLAWRNDVPADLKNRAEDAISRALRYLAQTQREDGAWQPLWFGNQHAASNFNLAYGTSRVLLSLSAMHSSNELPARCHVHVARAVDWLLLAQNGDGGWGGSVDTPASIEETALAVESLCMLLSGFGHSPLPVHVRDSLSESAHRGIEWLIERTDCGRQFAPTPIGFYFANLWYYEELYPLIFTVAALGRARAAGFSSPAVSLWGAER